LKHNLVTSKVGQEKYRVTYVLFIVVDDLKPLYTNFISVTN